MEHTHFLLQYWLAWWQNIVTLFANGGCQVFNNLCIDCNFEKNPARDAAVVGTGTGSGAAATRNAARDLFGLNTPATESSTGGEAIKKTAGEFIHQAADGIFGGSESGTSTAPSSTSAPSTAAPRGGETSLSDLLPPDMGGGTGSSASGSKPSLADFLPPEPGEGKSGD